MTVSKAVSTISIDVAVWEKFGETAAELDISRSHLLTQLIQNWLNMRKAEGYQLLLSALVTEIWMTLRADPAKVERDEIVQALRLYADIIERNDDELTKTIFKYRDPWLSRFSLGGGAGNGHNAPRGQGTGGRGLGLKTIQQGGLG